MTDHVDGCKALVTKDVADCDCVSMLRAEIERLTALAQVMGEERDRAWTEHLIERENLKAENEQLRATINDQSAAIERADRLVLACEQHLRDAKHEITKLREDMREGGLLR